MKLSDSLHLPETRLARARAVLLLAGVCFLAGAPVAQAAVAAPAQGIQQGGSQQPSIAGGASQAVTAEKTGTSLESAAAKAGDTARTVAMSLIGAFIIAVCEVLLLLHGFSTQIQYLAIGVIVLFVIMLQTLADTD